VSPTSTPGKHRQVRPAGTRRERRARTTAAGAAGLLLPVLFLCGQLSPAGHDAGVAQGEVGQADGLTAPTPRSPAETATTPNPAGQPVQTSTVVLTAELDASSAPPSSSVATSTAGPTSTGQGRSEPNPCGAPSSSSPSTAGDASPAAPWEPMPLVTSAQPAPTSEQVDPPECPASASSNPPERASGRTEAGSAAD